MIFLYPQKTIKNHMFSDVFMEYTERNQWHEMR